MAEENAQAEAEETAAEVPEAKTGGGRNRVLLGVVALVVVAGGGGAVWYLGFSGGGADESHAAEVDAPLPEVGALAPLDPFIANLADEDGKRYLKATLELEFFGNHVPDVFQARLAQVRDLLLTLFTSKTFEEVRTPGGKAVLRDEIINRLNRVLRKDLVKAVYFTEFIVQ